MVKNHWHPSYASEIRGLLNENGIFGEYAPTELIWQPNNSPQRLSLMRAETAVKCFTGA